MVTTHPRRSLLYVPGDDRHKIEKSVTLSADCICLDLEDGVAQNRKKEARQGIAAALREVSFAPAEVLVRINPVGSGLEQEDVDSLLPLHAAGVVLPKVESLDQVRWLDGVIEARELAQGLPLGSIRILADVETASGILSLREIASHPRLDALIFGGEDYAASVGALRTPEAWELFTARSMVVMHARAFGLQAIDMVTVDYHDMDHLRREASFGTSLGYTGKQVIHPAQVGPVQEAFTPGEAEIAQAREVVEAFEEQQNAGRGAFGMNGKMIDMPLVKAARNVLDRAHLAGRL